MRARRRKRETREEQSIRERRRERAHFTLRLERQWTLHALDWCSLKAPLSNAGSMRFLTRQGTTFKVLLVGHGYEKGHPARKRQAWVGTIWIKAEKATETRAILGAWFLHPICDP